MSSGQVIVLVVEELCVNYFGEWIVVCFEDEDE